MARKANPDLYRVCLTVNKHDFRAIQEMFPQEGASAVTRALHRSFLHKINAKASEKENLLPQLEIDISDIEQEPQ